MRFLITINHLEFFGGAEKFVLHLIKGLLDENRSVFISTLTKGKSYIQALALGAIEWSGEEIDIILVNHNSTVSQLTSAVTAKAKVFQICHGKYPYLEQPIIGVDGYFAVSPEVQQFLFRSNLHSQLLWNPAEFQYSKCEKDIDILVLAQGEQAATLVKARFGKKYNVVVANKHKGEISRVEDAIARSRAVVGTGRALIEATAQGVCSIGLDDRHYDGLTSLGPIQLSNWRKISKTNFSGRERENVPVDESFDWLSQQLRYSEKFPKSLFYEMRAQHDVGYVVDDLLHYVINFPRKKRIFGRRKYQIYDLRSANEKSNWTRKA